MWHEKLLKSRVKAMPLIAEKQANFVYEQTKIGGKKTRQCTSGPKRLKHCLKHAGNFVSRTLDCKTKFSAKFTWH
jgi:hypothetical protein